MVCALRTMGTTGNGESGFDSGEGAFETTATSKEGSMHVTYPMPTRRDSDKKYQYRSLYNLNEYTLNPLTKIYWRASLVQTAAVIPAPIAYVKGVAVKKLVVGSHGRAGISLFWCSGM